MRRQRLPPPGQPAVLRCLEGQRGVGGARPQRSVRAKRGTPAEFANYETGIVLEGVVRRVEIIEVGTTDLGH
jgi:hypothetical protein